MIASLKGIINSRKPDKVIIEVNGIGYHVSIPLCSLSSIPETGEQVFLHTYTHVREDALQLYGFLSEQEKETFIMLIGITGIGPKLALAILSGMPAQRFLEAVHNEDLSLLTAIPGLGRKTASRLILELRGKLLPGDSAQDPVAGDAISALVNLGYKRPASEKAVDNAMSAGASSIEDIVKESLKYLTNDKQ